MRRFLAVVAALAATYAVAPAATISGNGTYGDFSGTLTYAGINATSGTITVTLTNTSPIANGGYLTGFAFNLSNLSGQVTGMTLVSSDPDFQLVGGSTFDNSVTVSPYGQSDVGAALGGNWTGGGSPNDGLGVGQSGTFTFTVTGTASFIAGLSDTALLGLLTDTTGPGGNQQDNFIVRFKGFNNGASDKVPDDPSGNVVGEPDVVPEPATLVTVAVLGGMGLIGYRLRRKKA